jgi:tetratricopeptide (TPR) repeat protein
VYTPLPLQDCDRALKLAPRSFKALYARGLARESLGRFDEAIADYRAALEELDVSGGDRA